MTRLFFDIETVADSQRLALLPPPSAPANYKDSEKIAAYIAAKEAEQRERAALDPDVGCVRAIGWQADMDGQPVALVTGRDGSETEVIAAFWDAFAKSRGRAVGWNILQFDFPFLLRRSLALGVRPALIPNLAHWRQMEPITDLYLILYNGQPGRGLKWLAAAYGLPNACPDIDGSQVADLDHDQVAAYVQSDVALTVSLFDRMNGIYFTL